MAEKGKKRLSRRAQERLRRSLRTFDLTMLAVAATVAVAGFVCTFGHTSLDGANPAGFALWFLLMLSYPLLGTLSVVKALCGLPPLVPGTSEAGFLVALDLGWCVFLWLLLRYLGKRHSKSALLHISTRIALVILCWGWFQLLCAAAMLGWERGGLASYHRKLYHQSDPQPVVIVSDPNLPGSSPHRSR